MSLYIHFSTVSWSKYADSIFADSHSSEYPRYDTIASDDEGPILKFRGM